VNVNKLPVIEIFGPTIQGEGAVIGLKTMFVRIYGCDYKCKWCDSSFTWDGSGKTEVNFVKTDDIIQRLQELGLHGCRYVTISGGNPALYGEPVKELIHQLHLLGKKVVVETQGSIDQDWFQDVDMLTISPKPPSSGMDTDWGALSHMIDRLDANKVFIKVVVFDDNDYRFAKQVHKKYPALPFYLQAGNEDVKNPGNISGRLLSKLEWLFNVVMEDPDMTDARVLPQLHALVWSNKRGI
jgi:7-carboxy-7-deazaguanine synthase